MSDALRKAEAAVTEAADNTDVLRIVTAVLATQQAQQPAPAAPAPAPRRHPVGLYVTAGIGGAVALSFLAMAAALLAVAVAVGAVAVTVCLLVLRAMWRDLNNH
ncbi:hypothetical protein [Streptomyces sp. NPDC094468]|uniref:hypothetical protein n=1 Tax=Streptomyces sp. NPDC094468 TaxID=3366066 RepID=UPI0038024F73